MTPGARGEGQVVRGLSPPRGLVQFGRTGFLDWCGPCGVTSLQHRHGHRWWPRLRVFAGPSVVTGATDINADLFHSCVKAMEHMALGSGPGPDITVDPDGKQAIYVGPLLGALTSSDLPLAHELFCPFSPISYPVLAHQNGAQPPSAPSHPHLGLVARSSSQLISVHPGQSQI